MKILFMTCVLLFSTTPGLADNRVERIANYGEASRVFAFSSIMRNALDTFMWIIAYDSHANFSFRYGPICNLKYDTVYDAEQDDDIPSTFYGCHPLPVSVDNASQTLFDAYKQTLLSAKTLRARIEAVFTSTIAYERTHHDQAAYNKAMACSDRNTHKEVPAEWKIFHNNYKREHQLYSYERRKHIINRHFIAIKRSYGLYASRLRKISQNIEREYDCDRDGPEASPTNPPNVGN